MYSVKIGPVTYFVHCVSLLVKMQELISFFTASVSNWECGSLQYGLCIVIIKAAIATGVKGFCGCRDKSIRPHVKNEDGVVKSFSTHMWAMADYNKNSRSET